MNETDIIKIDNVHKSEVLFIKTNQFNEVCRMCMSRKTNLLPLRDFIPRNIIIFDILGEYADFYTNNSNLPQNVCQMCSAILNTLNDFINKLKYNQYVLNEIISNEKASQTQILVEAKQVEDVEVYEEGNVEEDIEVHVEDDVELNEEDNSNGKIKIESILEKRLLQSKYVPCNLTLKNTETEEILVEARQEEDVEGNVEVHKEENVEVKKGDNNNRNRLKKFRCARCDIIFKSNEELLQHRREAKHPREIFHPCTVCGRMFTNTVMKLHMRSHTKEKPFQCSVCSQFFSLRGNLRRHEMVHTGERPHICEICGQGFIQAPSLTCHMKYHHTGEAKAVRKWEPTGLAINKECEHCGKVFKVLRRYEAHLRKHMEPNDTQNDEKTIKLNEDVREYGCDVCKRLYKTKQMLKQHQLLSHGEKRFLCSVCGKGFVNATLLKAHLRVHTGEKPYQCKICHKSFTFSASFDSHMLIHTGVKPHKCKVCSRQFTQRNHLKYHLRTHSGEKPYRCSFCNKTFALNGNLTVHTRIHTGVTPYKCPDCGKGFRDSSSMKKHRRIHMKINILEDIPINDHLIKAEEDVTYEV